MDATARRAGLLAVAAVLAAAIVAVAARRRGGPVSRDPVYRCACGAAYRVSGVDRHRIYWPEGAPDGSPVLGGACLGCGAELPTGHDAVAA